MSGGYEWVSTESCLLATLSRVTLFLLQPLMHPLPQVLINCSVFIQQIAFRCKTNKSTYFSGKRSIAVELEMPWLLGLMISTCLNSEPSFPLIHHLRTLVSCGAGRFILYSNIDISFECNASPYLRHIYCFKLICFSTSNCLNDSFEAQLLTKNYLASILDKY